jgi:hypothetical protein
MKRILKGKQNKIALFKGGDLLWDQRIGLNFELIYGKNDH